MPTEPLLSDDLLDPIAADQPAGADLRWTPEWDRIKEARRADDDLESGKWVKKDRKVADWPLVKELATTILRERSKDLQIAVWLIEASIKLHGFAGLRDTLRLTRELMVRYWDKGLYPTMEDGPEDRVGPFEWLGDKMADCIIAIPITARFDQGRDYSLIDLKEAQRVGSEAGFKKDGAIDTTKKKLYEAAVAQGRISMEMFERAIRESDRGVFEDLFSDFQQASDEFKKLEEIIEEKFTDATPNLAAVRNALSEIGQAMPGFLSRTKQKEPILAPAALEDRSADPAERTDRVIVRFPLAVPNQQEAQTSSQGSWHQAETLIRSGQVDRGLAEMTRLAASETSGRNRFQRKLLLAEVCLSSKREDLARLILEELAEQIEKYQLEQWENSELIGAVWTRLYKLYRQGAGGAGDADRAKKLYERLCRLDPWQALGCSEG